MKAQVIPLLALGATLAGCGDSVTAARSPNDDAARLHAAAAAGATLALEDAASRAAPALGDRAAGATITASLGDLAAAIRRGDGLAALHASRQARLTLAAYAASASRDDASDRDVIALALDGADRLLASAAAAQ